MKMLNSIQVGIKMMLHVLVLCRLILSIFRSCLMLCDQDPVAKALECSASHLLAPSAPPLNNLVQVFEALWR